MHTTGMKGLVVSGDPTTEYSNVSYIASASFLDCIIKYLCRVMICIGNHHLKREWILDHFLSSHFFLYILSQQFQSKSRDVQSLPWMWELVLDGLCMNMCLECFVPDGIQSGVAWFWTQSKNQKDGKYVFSSLVHAAWLEVSFLAVGVLVIHYPEWLLVR